MTAYTNTRVPYARPHGAPSVMAGNYSGVELTHTCLRPGAYDAMALPSVQFGKARLPSNVTMPTADLPRCDRRRT
jgi:hypothetical protein